MESVLARGNTLAKLLLQHSILRGGSLSILSPDLLDPSQILQFDSGHFPQEPVQGTVGGLPGSISPVADSDDELVRLIYDRLELPDSVCVMENLIARVSDPWLRQAKSCVVTRDSEVFHVVFKEDHLRDKIAYAISDARRGPDFIGAVGPIDAEMAKVIKEQKAITTSDLERIAEGPWLVFVGAYDAEGYVIWQRNSH
jgi:hypothetical protein